MNMTRATSNTYWRGLGHWNFYFLLKFGLLWAGYLNFHPLANSIFLAFLLMPLPKKTLHKIRQWLALPIGLALFYYDTWLPSVKTIMNSTDKVMTFSGGYMLELLQRFINWPLIGVAFVAFILYLFIARWLRVTTLTVVMLLWFNLQPFILPLLPPTHTPQTFGQNNQAPLPNSGTNMPSVASPMAASNWSNQPATTATLNDYLENFYQTEKSRVTQFPTTLSEDATPFDILLINVCSLGFADLEAVGLTNHPLWKKLDITFSQFNSSTAYSGPASIRLLRASCGQTAHSSLYQPMASQCYLMDNLQQLGFTPNLAIDHSGKFDDYLQHLRDYARVSTPLMSQAGLSNRLVSFIGEPVYQTDQLLNRWLEERTKNSDSPRQATFINLTTLHDGNKYIDQKTTDYKSRAQTMLDDLEQFLEQLELSGRKVLVLLVPEHGAAVEGDKMQMSGLRDIPSLSITHVPAGLKLIGIKAKPQGAPLSIDQPSSYLAISELIARLVDGKTFESDFINWQALTQNLPQTPAISENENAVVMQYQGKAYVRLNKGNWVAYPQ